MPTQPPVEARAATATEAERLFAPPGGTAIAAPARSLLTTASPTAPGFLFLTESDANEHASNELDHVIATAASGATRVLGFQPAIQRVALGKDPLPTDVASCPLTGALNQFSPEAQSRFILPATLEFGMFARQRLAEAVGAFRRNQPQLRAHYDDPDPCHRLVQQAFFDEACHQLDTLRSSPDQTGLLLVAAGDTDPDARAQCYRLMRLLWERLGVQRGEVAFLRHAQTPLPEQLATIRATRLNWIVLPQFLQAGEAVHFARTILSDFQKRHPETAHWSPGRPVGEHPAIAAWLQERMLSLWTKHREREQTRERSPRYKPVAGRGVELQTATGEPRDVLRYGDGLIARAEDSTALRRVMSPLIRDNGPFFIKVTWHGYATGTYTDAVALDRLLGALPGRAVILEGHTSSRNTGGREIDWENDARPHREWIRRQDRDYLERTGLREVMERHGATYLNVTEASWDGQCADAAEVESRLGDRAHSIRHRELLEFVPQVVLDHPEGTFISFARFKGPTRLSISNCFGLIPTPLRSRWHGPNISHFAQVCCDMATIYGSLLKPVGIVEAFHHAVRWQRDGLYRSRWGNYDLVNDLDLLTAAPGLATADVLASRLQGQDVNRSAFFDVVRANFGLNETAVAGPIDGGLIARFT